MASPSMKKPTSDREAAIQEVVRGRELAARLHSLLSVDPRRELVHGLMEEVSQSFTRALSLLKPTGISEAIQELASMEEDSVCSGNQGSEASGEKVRTSPHAKGVHSRRRPLQSWTIFTSTPHHDGHEWRKYGQKKILSSDFPRSYYRCTHRDDQGCPAAKLVQQKDCNDPPMYVVTYIRHHACKKGLPTPQLPVNCSPSEPCMLSFGSDWSGIKQVQSLLSSFNSTGEGHMGDDVISAKFDAISSSNDPPSLDLTTLESLDPAGDDMLSGMSFSPNSDGFDKHLLMDPWNLGGLGFGDDSWSFLEV
ncbi:WRKY DNA-binding transcription factor 70-like isoform X1 [Phoenix dactylifera]|uniref:WRKY DNA-binding transcription factor 70-like isoform X1 n=1 Tax=Phoenix dactylifera TaxID=42345 RepID=A0A8B9AAR6_PHODC|nr:WRKY DNA-binding transcription factor 70-like isoform X1 [Phoenix dactylifera]